MIYNIVVVGLGYVGLPLAARFCLAGHNVHGIDNDKKRIDELMNGINPQDILTSEEVQGAKQIQLRFENRYLTQKLIYIVTVPTPINEDRTPDFSPLINASENIGSKIKAGDIVVYESTVYPGATEEICLPILERKSGLKVNQDFGLGYSPERVNPGDPSNTIDKITKVVSATNQETLETLTDLYETIVTAGVHKAESIQVAEASKILENTQRDVNIALINEFESFLHKKKIDIHKVLAAAGTKWNFVKYTPGLVGGHCIGVDPYYCIYEAKRVHSNPIIMTSARIVNENYLHELINRFVIFCNKKHKVINGSSILFYGVSFKPNCADKRNSLYEKAVSELQKLGAKVDVLDPILKLQPRLKKYDIIIVGSRHESCEEDLKYITHHLKYYLVP